MKSKTLEYRLIDRTSPILGSDGSRGGVRHRERTYGRNFERGEKFAGGSARILRRKGQKEEGQKGVFLRKPSEFVDGKRKRRECTYVRMYVCAFVYVCMLSCN